MDRHSRYLLRVNLNLLLMSKASRLTLPQVKLSLSSEKAEEHNQAMQALEAAGCTSFDFDRYYLAGNSQKIVNFCIAGARLPVPKTRLFSENMYQKQGVFINSCIQNKADIE